MTSTPSAGAGELEVEARAAKAAPAAVGTMQAGLRPGDEEEAWTRDFVKRIACAKFLAAVAPWTAAARRAARSRDGAGVAAAAAAEGVERLWRQRRWWCVARGWRREKRRRRSDGEEGVMGWALGRRQIPRV